MADYKEDKIKGWQRSNYVSIDNSYGLIPKITFKEELIVRGENGKTLLQEDAGVITEEFSDPTREFNLLNPIDDTVIGTAKYVDIYTILYSLYRDLANKRDNVGG